MFTKVQVIVFQILFRGFQTSLRVKLVIFSGEVSFCRRATLRNSQRHQGRPRPHSLQNHTIDTEYDWTKVPPYNGSDPSSPLEV